MRSYFGPPWTDLCKVWCIKVFHHVPLKYSHEMLKCKNENLMTSHFGTLMPNGPCFPWVVKLVSLKQFCSYTPNFAQECSILKITSYLWKFAANLYLGKRFLPILLLRRFCGLFLKNLQRTSALCPTILYTLRCICVIFMNFVTK